MRSGLPILQRSLIGAKDLVGLQHECVWGSPLHTAACDTFFCACANGGLPFCVRYADNVRRNRRTTTNAEAPRAMPAHRGGPLGDIAPAADHGVGFHFPCASQWNVCQECRVLTLLQLFP